MKHIKVVAGLVAALALGSVASAQTEPAQRPAPPPAARRPLLPKPKIGLRILGTVDAQTMMARDSFKAVLDKPTLTGYGIGAEVLNLHRAVFLRVSFSTMSQSGTRAFVSNGDVFSLGVPMKVTLTPIELGIGWRYKSHHRGLVTPYIGAGLISLAYKETADFAAAGDDVSERFNGFTAFGGVDFTIARHLSIGAEGQFRSVPNALGSGGLSEAFGETDLGGYGVRVMFGVRK